MGEIIRLRPRHGARPETTAHPETDGVRKGDATILLFTGVRYERYGEGKIEAAKTDAGKIDAAKAGKRPLGRGGRRRRA